MSPEDRGSTIPPTALIASIAAEGPAGAGGNGSNADD